MRRRDGAHWLSTTAMVFGPAVGRTFTVTLVGRPVAIRGWARQSIAAPVVGRPVGLAAKDSRQEYRR